MSSRHATAMLALCILPLTGFYLFRHLLGQGSFTLYLQSLPYLNAVEASLLGISTRNFGTAVAAALSVCLWIVSWKSYSIVSSPLDYMKRMAGASAMVLGIPIFCFLFLATYVGLRADLCLTIAIAIMGWSFRSMHFVLPTLGKQGGGRIDR